MKKLLTPLIAVAVVTASLSLTADQYAVALRDTRLVDKPFRDASSIGEIASETRVLVLRRKGGWYQVQSDNQTGWVRLTSLRLKRGGGNNKGKGKGKGKASAPGQKKKKVGSLETLGEALSDGLFTTGSSSSLAPTTAIRGLDEEKIDNASPDEKALALLDKYRVNSEQAGRFAQQAKLASARLDYLKGDSANTGSGGLLNFFGGGTSQGSEEDSF